MHSKTEEICRLAIANKASDIHLQMGQIPKMRINGQLMNITNSSPVEDQEIILSLLNAEQRERYALEKELDFSVTLDKNRFRANIFTQKGTPACALRVIVDQIPALDTLALPPVLKTFTNLRQGFVLIFRGP